MESAKHAKSEFYASFVGKKEVFLIKMQIFLAGFGVF